MLSRRYGSGKRKGGGNNTSSRADFVAESFYALIAVAAEESGITVDEFVTEAVFEKVRRQRGKKVSKN